MPPQRRRRGNRLGVFPRGVFRLHPARANRPVARLALPGAARPPPGAPQFLRRDVGKREVEHGLMPRLAHNQPPRAVGDSLPAERRRRALPGPRDIDSMFACHPPIPVFSNARFANRQCVGRNLGSAARTVPRDAALAGGRVAGAPLMAAFDAARAPAVADRCACGAEAHRGWRPPPPPTPVTTNCRVSPTGPARPPAAPYTSSVRSS